MTQGLLLFDAKGHLVICNRQYIDMFGVSPEIAKPGCHLRDLILHRQELGSFVGDVEAYCAKFLDPKLGVQDIVTSTIRLISKRSPGGGWATTMEDVTEGRRGPGKDRTSRPLRRAYQPAEPDAVSAPRRETAAGS